MKTQNRYGSQLWKGLTVRMTLPRGGNVVSTIAKLETRGAFVRAYGKRAVLSNGMSGAIDDCTPAPRVCLAYGSTNPGSELGATWIESEMFCTAHGRFERFGYVKHVGTDQLVRVRLDVPDTYFSIPATTANAYGYVSTRETENGQSEYVFHPYSVQDKTPAEFRRETRKAYK